VWRHGESATSKWTHPPRRWQARGRCGLSSKFFDILFAVATSWIFHRWTKTRPRINAFERFIQPTRLLKAGRRTISFAAVFYLFFIFNDSRQTNCLKIYLTYLRQIFRVGELWLSMISLWPCNSMTLRVPWYKRIVTRKLTNEQFTRPLATSAPKPVTFPGFVHDDMAELAYLVAAAICVLAK